MRNFCATPTKMRSLTQTTPYSMLRTKNISQTTRNMKGKGVCASCEADSRNMTQAYVAAYDRRVEEQAERRRQLRAEMEQQLGIIIRQLEQEEEERERLNRLIPNVVNR